MDRQNSKIIDETDTARRLRARKRKLEEIRGATRFYFYRLREKIFVNDRDGIRTCINNYKKLREEYISMRQNPKEFDDAYAEITYNLNEIPISLN